MGDLDGVDALATWSSWVPLGDAQTQAPRDPGVYMGRQGPSGPVVYVGMAGERRGQGIRGRLGVYTRGKGLVSGLGEAAMDRALADPEWLRVRLAEVDAGDPMRATRWGQEAVHRADLHVRWATTTDRAAARVLERAVLTELKDVDLWNRLK